MGKYLKLACEDLIQGKVKKSDRGEGVMEKSEILRTLSNCGLSEYESKVYSSLVLLGPSKAGTISKESKVPQSKIYEVLDQLAQKKLVEVFEGRPKEFKAADPETALKNVLEEKSKELDILKLKVEKMSNFLKPVGKEEVTGGVWTIKGEKYIEFFNKAAEMLDRSEKYIYAITKNFSRSSSLARAVKRCVKRKVKIRVMFIENIDKKNFYKAKWYNDHGMDLRFLDTKVHPRVVVADGKEILLRLDYNPKKRNRFRFNSLWSEDPSLVTVMDNYVKSMWKNSEPINFDKIEKKLKKSG